MHNPGQMQTRLRWFWSWALVVLLASVSLLAHVSAATASAQAQPGQRCFVQTNQCISGPIRSYWERNGGLSVFGYPISPRQTERVEGRTLPVQWFERDRLEDHGARGVLAGRLGARLLELQGRPWETFPHDTVVPPGCRYFVETQHTLCEPFLSYWNNNGGLARFGYPITQSMGESVGNWFGIVQYFERRRMEHHTELSDTKHAVLLGLLGRTIRDVEALTACPTPLYDRWALAYTRISFRGDLGCPQPVARDIPAVWQLYEHGMMIWLDRGDQRTIYAIVFMSDSILPSSYRQFVDTWDASQPASSGLAPPAGLLEPMRGFGKVWRENPDVRAQLGWATTPEAADRTDVQGWSSGGAMLWLLLSNDFRHQLAIVYAFVPGGGVEAVSGF